MLRFAAVFALLLAAAFAIELTPPVQAALVAPWTEGLARLSAALLTSFDPNVASSGRIVQSTRNGFAVSIEAGCNGVEAALILACAIVAYPAPWRNRLLGMAIGLVAVQALNVVRVVTLFYLGQWSERAFEWAHLYLWQALVMLDVVIVWMIWIRSLPPRPAAVLPNAG